MFNIHEWHTWFAWHPVTLTLSHRRVWLQPIYRRAKYHTFSTQQHWQRWEYGTILCMLKLPRDPENYRV
jgi:hypothetical protein